MTENLVAARKLAEATAGAAWATMPHRARLEAIREALDAIRAGIDPELFAQAMEV